jgi:hypothetical protein
MVTLVV